MSHHWEVPQYAMFLLNHIMDKNQKQESPDDQNYQIKYFHELFYIEMMIIDARKFILERRRDSKDNIEFVLQPDLGIILLISPKPH